jgi:hypothetical protein
MEDDEQGLLLKEIKTLLKGRCKVPCYIQEGSTGGIFFNPLDDRRATRRWHMLRKLALGKDPVYDSVLPLDKPLSGNWKWGPKVTEIYQTEIQPRFKRLQSTGELTVVLQSPLDVTHRDVIFSGETMDKRVQDVCNLKDVDHLAVEYTREVGEGVVVKTFSSIIKQCLRDQFRAEDREDGGVLVKRFKQNAIEEQVKLWQRALSEGRSPVVFQLQQGASPAKKIKTEN